MYKTIAFLGVILSAGQASADNCPDFYRFVDFGLFAQDGRVYRGGPTFRAESLEGAPLMLRGRSECRKIRDISKDGHGNPIPVVTRVYYKPERTGIDLTELTLRSVDRNDAEAEENASAHRASLARADTATTRGADFLCAQTSDDDTLSCQIVSPYPGNIALVVYCDARQCDMPAMAVQEGIMVGAVWPRPPETLDKPEKTGSDIVEKARQIHDFLDPLS